MARTAERTLTVVLDPHDDVATLNRLRRLHARPFGQVVCEPAPAAGPSGLARSVLAALGKDPDLGPRRDPLWRLVDVHLRAERTRQLIVLRAHTLTYAALRRLADITDDAEIHLWLVVHTERIPGPVAQLLEGLPHDTGELDRLLEHTPDLTDEHDDVDELPVGAGLEFPYLQAIDGHDARPRSAIVRSLSRAQRAAVHDVLDQAHAWMTRWIDEHPDATYQQSADAVYLLARHGDSASEIYTRIRAALDAFTRAGEDTDVRAVDAVLQWSFGEVRSCEFNATYARAGTLADQTCEPQLAALIALAAVMRCPRYIRELDHNTVAADGSRLFGPWGGLFAIPPELRRFIATQHEHLSTYAKHRSIAMLPGNSHGRMSQTAIRRALAELDASDQTPVLALKHSRNVLQTVSHELGREGAWAFIAVRSSRLGRAQRCCGGWRGSRGCGRSRCAGCTRGRGRRARRCW